ncbi:hypothetical protein BYT27DRAFT_7281894 [Phlegmacium glaucopus]|nr:hypothetical protein BYT27DRAFT_7281894 [Phlegmacium glaucopus]
MSFEQILTLPSSLRLFKGGSAATSNISAPDVSDIIISHWHHDRGLPAVLSLLKNWKNTKVRSCTNILSIKSKPEAGEYHGSHNVLPDIDKILDQTLYTAAPDGSVFHNLYDGQTIGSWNGCVRGSGRVYDEFEGSASALPLSSPFLENQGETEVNSEYDNLFPGHRAVLMNGQEIIATYIKHRLERETQIVEVLRLPVLVGHRWTAFKLVDIESGQEYLQNLLGESVATCH